MGTLTGHRVGSQALVPQATDGVWAEWAFIQNSLNPKPKEAISGPQNKDPPLPWGLAPLRRKLVEIRGTEWCSQATTNTLEPEFRGWTPVQIH